MLRFEEFGTHKLEGEAEAKCQQDYDSKSPGYCRPLPMPVLGGGSKKGNYTPYGCPENEFLDEFLGQPLYPYPTEYSNNWYSNPWEAAIVEEHTGPMTPLVAGDLITTRGDGRPPGAQFAHQRWHEFAPLAYSQTAQAGIRTNSGFRDEVQLHRYGKDSEWGPGGLYYNTVHSVAADACEGVSTQALCEEVANEQIRDGFDKMCSWRGPDSKNPEVGEQRCRGIFDGTTNGILGRFHPLFPVQDHQALRTFDGTFPPKLQMARYGEPLLFRHSNATPIKFDANRGFGNHFLTTHHHNGHNPAESDGFAQAFFLPGQYYDYHWPMILAGHDEREGAENNIEASNPKASTPCSPGEELVVSYPSPAKYGEKECSFGERLAENPSKNVAGVYTEKEQCGWRREAATCNDMGLIQIPGDWKETMSTHWFHDHMLDYTAQNVYKGNAAMMNIYSGLDPGREGWKCHYEDPENNVNLCLPSGSKLPWGNRDYDVNLELAGKAWGQDTAAYLGNAFELDNRVGTPPGEEPNPDVLQGQLWFATFNTNGFLGDRMTVNWLFDPYLNVRARKYRFRMLNAHVSRFLRNALVVQRNHEDGELPGERAGISYDRVPFYLVGNDGNIMEHSIAFDGKKDLDADGDLQEHNAILPTQSIAERWDIVVDFSEDNSANLVPGDKLYWVNLLEHRNGRRPHEMIPLADVLSGAYAGAEPDAACDTVVGKFLEMRVFPCTKPDGSPAADCKVGGEAVAYQQDRSMDPALYIEGNTNGPGGTALTMIPMPRILPEELENAHHRTFVFGRGAATDSDPKTITEATDTDSAAPVRVAEKGGDFLFSINGESVNLSEHHSHPVTPDLPWGIKTDGGDMLTADMHRVSAAPKLGDLEIWHLVNGGGGWSHNVHIHYEEGRILSRDGKPPPDWEKWSRKDVYRVGRMDDSGDSIVLAMRTREFGGAYMEHCHNTQHEDHAMLLRWDVENPNQLKPFLTPENQWNGCTYTESFDLPTARTQENGVSRDPQLVGDFEAREDFLKDGNASQMLCDAGAVENCVSTGLPAVSPSAPAPAPSETASAAVPPSAPAPAPAPSETASAAVPPSAPAPAPSETASAAVPPSAPAPAPSETASAAVPPSAPAPAPSETASAAVPPSAPAPAASETASAVVPPSAPAPASTASAAAAVPEEEVKSDKRKLTREERKAKREERKAKRKARKQARRENRKSKSGRGGGE